MVSRITALQQISPSLLQPLNGQTPQSAAHTVNEDSPVTVLSHYHAKPFNSFLFHWSLFQDALLTPLCSLQTTQTFTETLQVEAATPAIFDMIEIQIQYIALVYSLRNVEQVLRLLREQPFLISLLIEARSSIARYFSHSAIFLDVETDPEEINGAQLVALVETDSSPEEAYRKLKQFDEDWWLEVMARAQTKLCISVEFR